MRLFMTTECLLLLIFGLAYCHIKALPVNSSQISYSIDDFTNETNRIPQHEEEESEEDDEESEEVEELIDRNRDTFVDEALRNSKQYPSVIESAFNNKKTFSCPKIKTDLKTGTSIGDLSPEDIEIIAAMGDSLSTGIGLWPRTNIEFRGAAFSSGGDATIDGLITIPNILREFNPNLHGVSHGMGTSEQLPEHMLNVAKTGAYSRDLPEQAVELVRRLNGLREVDYKGKWVMIIITIGTEETCFNCGNANVSAITEAVDILMMGIPKALVVLLGPLHVSPMSSQKENILWKRCPCDLSTNDITHLAKNWTVAFKYVQEYFEDNDFKSPTFGLLAIPSLTITSRFPKGLFLLDKPLLSRRGHMYATKWLWNRLIAGHSYNLSSAILSQDTYFCPSTGCPYFRTTANMHGCQLLSLNEAQDKELHLGSNGKVFKKMRRSRERLYAIAAIIFVVAFFVVLTLGTVFYQNSKHGDHGRFEVVEPSQLRFEEAKKEEERNLISRQNTRALSTDPGIRSLSVSQRRLNSESERSLV